MKKFLSRFFVVGATLSLSLLLAPAPVSAAPADGTSATITPNRVAKNIDAIEWTITVTSTRASGGISDVYIATPGSAMEFTGYTLPTGATMIDENVVQGGGFRIDTTGTEIYTGAGSITFTVTGNSNDGDVWGNWAIEVNGLTGAGAPGYALVGQYILNVGNANGDGTIPTSGGIGSELDGTGITDPNVVRGWLPPGPVDSIMILPINLLNSIALAGAGACNPPEISLLGHTRSMICGQEFWTSLGSPISTTVSSGFIVFFLLFWLRSLYHRLERATSFRTTAHDAYGVL